MAPDNPAVDKAQAAPRGEIDDFFNRFFFSAAASATTRRAACAQTLGDARAI